jgi:multiple sugar transport system substrate-binding protein
MRNFFLVVVCCAVALSGCSGLSKALTERFRSPVETDNAAVAPPAANSTTVPTVEPTILAAAQTPDLPGTTTPAGPLTLLLWAPPQFDPASGTPAGKLLQKRLEEFVQRRPEVQIEVRVKSLDGAGGLFESLVAATAAAQRTIPDLVALPHPLAQTAAVKGLLHPMNGLTNTLDDPDWYGYARQLASLQNSIFGLPFAGDALVQVYRTAEGAQPMTDWQRALAAKSPLAFAAADPQALFTLALYQAVGGQVSNDQGQPVLEVEPLVNVLDFYKSAEQVNTMPYWLTQFQTDDPVWEAFRENRAGAMVTWLSRYYQEGLADTDIAQLPTPDGKPFTLASGWVWALASPDPYRRQLAVQLAEFLTESSFLGPWSEAAGVLPTRSSALSVWGKTSDVEKLAPIAASARIYPPAEAINSLGQAVEEAVVQVLKRQAEPVVAAQDAANRSGLP